MGMKKATNPVPQEWDVEVDKKTEGLSGQTEIGYNLGFVDGQQLLDGLQLNDDSILHEQINPQVYP
jgi:hypothetical protein